MDVGAQQRKPPVANGNVCSIGVGFAEGKSGEPGRRVESACSNESTGCVVASIPPGRHATMGRAGGHCRQHHPDGVSCATEHLSRYSQLARTREWTAQKSSPKTISVACYVDGPISESAFLRRKVASIPDEFEISLGKGSMNITCRHILVAALVSALAFTTTSGREAARARQNLSPARAQGRACEAVLVADPL